ncbi:YkvA family protein [Aquabacter sp. CN5-332]|uniref:YkvA family protein n=1 Tax=Aquabacter sp. CN5-332 TaxID=3156608 RepID=UPI0032B3BD4B
MIYTQDGTDWSGLDAEDRQKAENDETSVRRGFWRKLKRHAAAVPFAEDAVAAYFAAFDRETPLKVRAGLLGALAYFLLPADFMPDFLPLIGFGDDAAVLFGAMQLLSSHIRPHHREAARTTLEQMKSPQAEA